jgi:N-acetylmuramoyl-L-alanine amidase
MEGWETMHRTMITPMLLATLLALGTAPDLGAVPPRDSAVALTALRSWSSPTSTRLVLDFSATVNPVVPDSGITRQLTVSFPAERVTRSAEVARVQMVQDGAVDSVEISEAGGSMQARIWFHDSTRFHVFPLLSEPGKPYRLVIDIARPGGAAAEAKRLESIAATKKKERVRLVAIDAGHGGEDTGARGPRGVIEKTVTLAVARALADELNETPGIRAVLTRNGDYFIPLRERYRIAERMKADVFVSIHANSSKRRGAGNGTEVYFLSLGGASAQADADLADIENAADLVGGVPSQAEDDLVNILYDVKRSSALQQSQLLAETILDRIGADRRLEVRGVKQAGFVVLKSVEFPSVLVETAFINNPAEARLLADRTFQKKMGKQLADGVRKYFQRAGIGLADPAAKGSEGL